MRAAYLDKNFWDLCWNLYQKYGIYLEYKKVSSGILFNPISYIIIGAWPHSLKNRISPISEEK